jgi:hypothetical protein
MANFWALPLSSRDKGVSDNKSDDVVESGLSPADCQPPFSFTRPTANCQRLFASISSISQFPNFLHEAANLIFACAMAMLMLILSWYQPTPQA